MGETWQPASKPWGMLTKQQQADRRVLWASGKLAYKLDPLQRKMDRAVQAAFKAAPVSTDRWFYLDCARRTGKDYYSEALAVSSVMKHRPPHRTRPIRIPYAAATRESVKEQLVPNMLALFEDCPPELLPQQISDGTFRKSADRLTFPWGSEIVMVGMDLHPDRLRGPATFACVFSEAAFYSDFGGTLRSVMLPMLQTEPDGWWMINTTPPESPEHEVDVEWLPEAKRTGRHFHATIDDNPRVTQAQKEAQIRVIGGKLGRKSTVVRRELFAEHVTEETMMIVPEWQAVKDRCVREFQRPEWVDCYEALDPGIVHFCAALGGFFDFRTDTLFVEWDFAAPGLNTWEVAVRLWAREWQMWGLRPQKPKRVGDAEWVAALDQVRGHFYEDLRPRPTPLQRWTGQRLQNQPHMRVSDTDMRLIADLATEHGLTFTPAQKDDRDAAINALRLRVQDEKVVVHPRCTHLISHLSHGIWNKSRKDFAEAKVLGGGKHHFDALAALVYLDRHIQRRRNPVPPQSMFLDPQEHHIPNQNEPPRTQAGEALRQVFGGRRTAQSGEKRKRLYQRNR